MVLKRLFLGLFLLACSRPAAPRVPALDLVDTAGSHRVFPRELEAAKYTVLIFYSDHCPCFRVHEERIRALAAAYADRKVAFVLVDSEASATTERDARSASERSLPPIVIDPRAELAHAVGAEYATYTVVLDSSGSVHYRGGIDSDRNRLTDGRQEYVRNALDDLLTGNAPHIAEGKTLGCALQVR